MGFRRMLLKATIGVQFLTALVHSLSFFRRPEPSSDKERILFELMEGYRRDLGAGFAPSMSDIVTALSACFTLLYLMGGWLNALLLAKRADPGLLKGILGMEAVLFGICFAIMAWLTFLPPIVLTGLVFLSVVAAWWTFRDSGK